MNQSISKGTVGHSMFIHIVILKVGHHVSKSCLSSRFGSLLLDFVHLFQVFFGCWVQLWAKAFLRLQWASFRFGYLIDLKSTTHGWMHHNFTRCLDLLETVQCDVIQVACTVEISLFVSHNLFKETITASLSLLFLEKQVICWRNLVMLIILNIRYSVCQVAVRADSGSVETVLDLA